MIEEQIAAAHKLKDEANRLKDEAKLLRKQNKELQTKYAVLRQAALIVVGADARKGLNANEVARARSVLSNAIAVLSDATEM